jgi:hypothetical protein
VESSSHDARKFASYLLDFAVVLRRCAPFEQEVQCGGTFKVTTNKIAGSAAKGMCTANEASASTMCSFLQTLEEWNFLLIRNARVSLILHQAMLDRSPPVN